MISTKLAQDTVDIRSIMLENQDLKIVSKPPDGIKWSRKTQQQLERKKKKQSKTEQNEDVKGQMCDLQNKTELSQDRH